MFILANNQVFDRLGYCMNVKLRVNNAEKIDYNGANQLLVDKHLAHEQLIENAFNKLASQDDEVKKYPVVTRLASFIIPELYDEANVDIPVHVFDCEDTDSEGIGVIVRALVQYDQLPVIILGMSNEEMDTLAVNDTIMMMLSLKSNRTAIAAVEIIPYDIPHVFSTARDKSSWGMLIPIVMMNPMTSEVSPISSQYAALNIYELTTKQ